MKEHLLNLFEEMKSFGPLPNVRTYTILINFYCKIYQGIEEAKKIFEEMQKRQISPSTVTYSTYIDGLFRVGEADFALDFIRDLRDNNKPLNYYRYNAIIFRFCATGEVNKALRIFDEMKSFGIIPDIHSYNILIDGFCKSQNVEKAIKLIEEMKANNIKPTVVTYNSLLIGFCKIGAMEIAIKMFYELENSRYKYDQTAYRSMTEALQLIDKMVNQCITSNRYRYNAVINRLCKDEKPEKALEVIPIMLKRNALHVASCNTLIDGFAKQTNLKKAYMLHEKMQKLGISHDIITWTILVNILCMTGQVGKANELLRDMLMMGLNPDTISYTSMIAGFCKNGYVNEAFGLFKKMPHMPSVVTYNCLIDGCCKVHRVDKALMLY
ncbi:PREDICTED: pentatricopeptide repeat-containing protein At5g64320, mitochondrial-like [Nicotiana attenuata]|uniref:pentatricopeptide repeat-containing protein At5g64320, mitochondrial-like n=1 Tax=Nicotiana attenuata TaxID=49451 RepID=UPI000904FB97|nr:PREDICTED: pentatricopeptide repeat-containing protein At5g64320, mitochondrial-like [Nicotiana attenuata]